HDRGEGVGRHQHGQLDGPARVRGDVPEQRQPARREAQAEPEDDQALWRVAPSRPVTPKVRRRLAAVFATEVTSSASTFATIAPVTLRRSANSTRWATVLATPIAAKRTSWRGIAR